MPVPEEFGDMVKKILQRFYGADYDERINSLLEELTNRMKAQPFQCQHCRYWDGDTSTPHIGICYNPHAFVQVPKPSDTNPDQVGMDTGNFCTGKEFGCVHFAEYKDGDPDPKDAGMHEYVRAVMKPGSVGEYNDPSESRGMQVREIDPTTHKEFVLIGTRKDADKLKVKFDNLSGEPEFVMGRGFRFLSHEEQREAMGYTNLDELESGLNALGIFGRYPMDDFEQGLAKRVVDELEQEDDATNS